MASIFTYFVLCLLSLTDFSVAVEDLSYCHNINFKHGHENCTDGGKYPILGNCTHYYKCDGLPTGVFLHEAYTDCPEGQLYDHKTSACIKGSSDEISNCDQKKCESFLQTESPEKVEDGRGKYVNPGTGSPQYPQYPPPPNQGIPQSPYPTQPGSGGYVNSGGDGHYVTPGQHEGHNDPNQPPFIYPTTDKGRNDGQGNKKDDKKNQKNVHGGNGGSSGATAAIFLISVSILLTSATRLR